MPWVFLGSLILNSWVGYSSAQQFTPTNLSVAFLIASASTLQGAMGGWLLRRVIGYPAPLDHGTQVTSFLLLSPIICLISATISATGLWALSIFDTASFASTWASWWVGDTLGVVVMFPLVMIIAGEPRALWRKRMFTVSVPMLLTFALFVVIYFKANQWEYSDSLSDFRQLSRQAVNQVQTKLEEQELLLEQTVGLFQHDVNGKVSRDEFHRFVKNSLNRFPVIQALEWAPEVGKSQRNKFEGEQRLAITGFEIREQFTDGVLKRAGDRDSYYPVTFVEPFATNEIALGYDLASNSVRLEAINKAKETGHVVATAAVKLVQEKEQQSGLLLMLAVNPNHSDTAIVLTVLRVGDFMDKVLRDLSPMLFTRLINLDEKKIIYDNFEAKTQTAVYEIDFYFGSRHYRIETAPTRTYSDRHHGWQSWSLLAAGILGSGLLGALLLLGTGYAMRIEALVVDRTRKLKENEEQLQDAQRIGRVGSWDWDATTDTVICSEESYLILDLDKTKPVPDYKGHLKLYTIESALRLDEAVKKSIQLKEPYELYLELEPKEGNRRWVTARSKIKLDKNNNFAGLTGTLTDITEHILTEELLLRQKHFADDVISSLPGIFICWISRA